MANETNIRSFTANDIEKYHKGLLSAKDMHALEKAALDDPFLADALEGYLAPGIAIDADLAELRKRLIAKTEKGKVIPLGTGGNWSFPWLRIAVMIILIAGAGLLAYQFLFKSQSHELAQVSADNKNKEVNTPLKPKDTAGNTPQPGEPGSTESLKEPVNRISTLANTDNTVAKGRTTEDKSYKWESNQEGMIAGDSANINSVAGTAKTPAIPVPAKAKEENIVQGVTADNKTLNNIAANKIDSTANKNFGYQAPAPKKQVPGNENEALAMLEKAKANAPDNKENINQDDAFYRNPKVFRGRVTDANNNALPFANITNTRDNVGTYSDAKGYFALLSADSVMNVQVKVVGFENKKINLQNGVLANQVVMQEDKSVAANVLDTVKRNYARRSSDAAMTFEEPEPADGWAYYDSYLANNLHVPETLDTRKKDGSDAVEVSFEVNKNGDPINLRIEKSLCDKCDKEAIRLIKEGPKWKRKAKKGKRATVTIPFTKTD
ncbi:MAG: carboxypeptidase-like regulatory domain-containing protein [Bacteroidota bacterium]|nr:carboxypeptidase-like regulatory domain-containing protein [Bacteroidota bacterium]